MWYVPSVSKCLESLDDVEPIEDCIDTWSLVQDSCPSDQVDNLECSCHLYGLYSAYMQDVTLSQDQMIDASTLKLLTIVPGERWRGPTQVKEGCPP